MSAILKYLLAHRERPVSRDYLMEWLWPGSNAKRARGSLNTAMHSLRAVLGGCVLPRGCPSHVVLEAGHYRLCEGLEIRTDVERFDLRCGAGRSLERRGLLEESATEYERAVELYRGDYLPEDLYEEWTMIERQRLAGAYLEVLERLCVYHFGAGQHERCVRACYKVLEKEPYYENGHRLVIDSYARLGRRTRALQQYRLYERALRDKFGLEPSAEVKDLHRCILQGGPRRWAGHS